jgi:DNA-binding transcriptional ArsR family regulator
LQSESKPSAEGCNPADKTRREEPDAVFLAEAFGNPLRNKIVSAVSESVLGSTDGGDDPKGITTRRLSEMLREPRRKVRYHLDVLVKQGLIRVVKVERRGGTMERYFGPIGRTILTQDDVSRLTPEQTQRALVGCLRLIIASAAAALDAGVAVERPEWAAVRMPVQVDEQGWVELGALHEGLFHEVDRIVAGAQGRLERSDGQPIDAVSANLLIGATPSHRSRLTSPPGGKEKAE